MMKKCNYETPQINIISATDDVIRTSQPDNFATIPDTDAWRGLGE